MPKSRLLALLTLTSSAFLNFPDTVMYGYQLMKMIFSEKKSIVAEEANCAYKGENAP